MAEQGEAGEWGDEVPNENADSEKALGDRRGGGVLKATASAGGREPTSGWSAKVFLDALRRPVRSSGNDDECLSEFGSLFGLALPMFRRPAGKMPPGPPAQAPP